MIDVHFPPFTRALWCNSMLQLFIESCDEQAHLSHMSMVILEALSDGWHLATDMLGQVTSRPTNPFPCHTMPSCRHTLLFEMVTKTYVTFIRLLIFLQWT